MKKFLSMFIAVAIMLSAIPVATPVEADVEFMLGDVNGDGVICGLDAVIISHFIDGRPTVYDNDDRAWKAALITNPEATMPTISDALEIILHLVGIRKSRLIQTEFGNCKCCLRCNDCSAVGPKPGFVMDYCYCESCRIWFNEWQDCKNGLKGNVTGGCEITMIDALQVLMYVANVPQSVLFTSEQAYQSACITGDEPGISDVLQILMYLANIESSKL